MAVTLVQSAFRVRGDCQAAQGGTPIWYAAQNAVAVPTQQAVFRIRFQIANTGSTAAATQIWQLYCSRNAGAYAAVTTGGTFVQSADGSFTTSADNSAITSSLLTGGAGTFVNGQYDSTGATAAQGLAATSYTEFEFGIIFTASIVASDTYSFEVFYNNLALNTYTNIPTLVPTKNLPDLAPTAVSYNRTTGQFSSVTHNAGPGDTPLGQTVACNFSSDGVQRSWGKTTPEPAPIVSGGNATTDSSSGGGPFTIPLGGHTIACTVNDGNRFTEVSTADDTLTVPIYLPPWKKLNVGLRR